jgi:hypothetical protein
MSDEKQVNTNGSNGKQDPSRNTREMVQDAVDRINDLATVQRQSVRDLANAETRRVDQLTALRDKYEEKLAVAEAGRLNANRTMDESARAVDRDKAATQATLLAADVKSTAETARLLVAQTRDEATKNLAQQLDPIRDKLAALEQAQFQGAGERRASDPAQLQMAEDVRALLRTKERVEGRAMLSTPMLMLLSGALIGFLVFLAERVVQ